MLLTKKADRALLHSPLDMLNVTSHRRVKANGFYVITTFRSR